MKYTNNIRKIREERNLTQEQLARILNTTNPQISNLELGKRRLTWEWMQRIARALECQPIDLVNEPGITNSLTEQQLLDTYRSLDQSQQETLHKMATFLHESSSQSFTPEFPPKKK